MPMYEVEDGIPMPELVRKSNEPKYPWRLMGVGQSFFIPEITAGRLWSQIAQAKKRTGYTFTARNVDGGVRVWRTA